MGGLLALVEAGLRLAAALHQAISRVRPVNGSSSEINQVIIVQIDDAGGFAALHTDWVAAGPGVGKGGV